MRPRRYRLIKLLEETVPVAAPRIMHQAETTDDLSLSPAPPTEGPWSR